MHIIVGDPFEKLSRRQFEYPVPVACRANIFMISEIPDAAVFLGVSTTNRFGPVGGCVVGDDEFEVAKVLLQD